MDNRQVIEQCHCNLCGHEWWPNSPKKPLACPACKRYDWWKPRKEKESA